MEKDAKNVQKKIMNAFNRPWVRATESPLPCFLFEWNFSEGRNQMASGCTYTSRWHRQRLIRYPVQTDPSTAFPSRHERAEQH